MSDVSVSDGTDVQGVIRALREPVPRASLALLLTAARARVPVLTGHLRSTGTLVPGGIQYSAPYAAPIHWGWRKRNIQPNPWVLRAADTNPWLEMYLETVTEPWGK